MVEWQEGNLAFAKKHKKWTIEQWNNVLWSNESKYEILSLKRRKFGEQMKDVCLKPTVKYGGGSIMVWRCLIANGLSDLDRIDGITNVEKYRQILIHHAIPSVKRLRSNGFIFLPYIFVVSKSLNSSHTITFTFALMPLRKVWTPLSPQLLVK